MLFSRALRSPPWPSDFLDFSLYFGREVLGPPDLQSLPKSFPTSSHKPAYGASHFRLRQEPCKGIPGLCQGHKAPGFRQNFAIFELLGALEIVSEASQASHGLRQFSAALSDKSHEPASCLQQLARTLASLSKLRIPIALQDQKAFLFGGVQQHATHASMRDQKFTMLLTFHVHATFHSGNFSSVRRQTTHSSRRVKRPKSQRRAGARYPCLHAIPKIRLNRRRLC